MPGLCSCSASIVPLSYSLGFCLAGCFFVLGFFFVCFCFCFGYVFLAGLQLETLLPPFSSSRNTGMPHPLCLQALGILFYW